MDKRTAYQISTYIFVLFVGYLWFGFLWEGIKWTRSEWHDRGSLSSAMGLVLTPAIMFIYSVAVPIWYGKAGKMKQAIYGALTGFLCFIPWLIFVGGKLTVGVAH